MARKGSEQEGWSYEAFAKMDRKTQAAMRRGFVDPERAVITEDGVVVRLVGMIHSVTVVWAVCSDGTKRPFVIDIEDKDHPLLTLLHEVTRGEWVDDPKGKKREDGKRERKKTFEHAGTRILADVEKNRVRPKTLFLWNCIDRTDKWCKDNKHCKILASNEKEKGFGTAVYKGLKDVIKENGNPEDYDVVASRTGKQLTTKYSVTVANKKVRSNVVKGKLSAAERTYGRYDLEELVAPTKLEKVVEHLEGLFKLADAELGTAFCADLGIGGRKPAVKKSKKGTGAEPPAEGFNA